jgi:hypothetical protein
VVFVRHKGMEKRFGGQAQKNKMKRDTPTVADRLVK